MGHSRKRKRNQNPPTNETSDTAIKTEENDDTDETPKTTTPINRRGRIIVRNLSFKTTEEKLKEHFEKFGPVTEIKILKRPDGKLVGCGFVQFQVVQNAAKAIFHTTGKQFLGRPIVCDWALGKNTYVKNIQAAFKEEMKKKEEEPIVIKDEVKEEKPDVTELENTIGEEKQDSEEEDSERESSKEESEDDDEEEEDESSEEDNESNQEEEEPETKKPRFESNDVTEGKTVFIKNVPFSATNEDIKECMSQFGPLFYALVCVDRVTEHSKGTAFVKFQNAEDAEKCLAAGTELTLMGNILDCHKAINRYELQNKSSKKDEKKDSRNLYLVKEGVILAGTKAAEGVSASDMAKRLELEKWKTQILRNFNMFVSRVRLVVHNLSPTCDDSKLKQIFAKYSGPKAFIREAKVMRDMRNLDNKGVGKSKEFGFVSFTNHEDALKALRAINNNPNIFSPTKRPIVAFSIENKSVINAKTRRLEKSKMNNPNWKKNTVNKEETHKTNKEIQSKTSKKKQKKNEKNKDKKTNEENNEITDQNNLKFAGITAKPGVQKMRNKFKLKTQAQLHHQHLKEAKKKKKFERKSLQQRQKDFIRQPQQKQNKKKNDSDDNFSKLVDKYKTIITNPKAKKSKWYET